MTTPQPNVTVYRTRMCPFCIAAAQFLTDRGVTMNEIYLDDHADRRSVTRAILPGHDTVPLVVIDDQPIGGFDALRALDASGELERLLGRA